MINLKKVAISFSVIVMLGCLAPTNMVASCWLCIKIGGSWDCTLVGGGCSDYDASLDNSSNRQCVGALMSGNPAENVIYTQSGQAWVMHEGKKTFLMSDAFVAFNETMKKKYAKSDKKDKKLIEQINLEYSNFIVKKDNHLTSLKIIEKISKETGFKIVANKK